MNVLVAFIGLGFGLIALMGVVAPKALIAFILRFKKGRIWGAVLGRLVAGIVFVVAADECHHPKFISIIGYFLIVMAFFLLFVGRKRLDGFMDSWVNLPHLFVRIWCLVAVLFSGYIVYASGSPLLSL